MVFGKVASCLAFQFNLHGMNSAFFLRAREKLHFLFLKKNFCEFQWNFSIANVFSASFPDSKCNLSPIFECISRRCRNVEHKKCWTRVEGECQQQSIMHEMQRKRVLGVKGFSFAFVWSCARASRSWVRKHLKKWMKQRNRLEVCS